MSRFREQPVRSALLIFLIVTCLLCFEGHFVAGKVYYNLGVHDSLSASDNDVLVSQNGRFAVGFFPDTQNRYYFGCWFTDGPSNQNVSKVVWVADARPGLSTSHTEWVGRRYFTVYTTTGRSESTSTFVIASTKALVLNSGNFVLYDENAAVNTTMPVFQSFSRPGDTLLPGQIFRPDQVLTSFASSDFKVSSTGVDPAPGRYALKYQEDGNLGLWESETNYWLSDTANAASEPSNYAVLDDKGLFNVTNIRGPYGVWNKTLTSVASGASGVYSDLVRRLTLDPDGNLRLYGQGVEGTWTQLWAAISDPECIPGQNRSVITQRCKNGVKFESPGAVASPAGSGKKSKMSNVMLLVIVSCVSIFGTGGLLAGVTLCCWLFRRRKRRLAAGGKVVNPVPGVVQFDSLESMKQQSSGSFVQVMITNSFLERQPAPWLEGQPKSFTFEEVQAATRNFRKVLGSGSFGKVYKGKLPDNQLIAVKKLEKSMQGQQQFQTEVLTIGSVFHPNLVRLYGFCSDEQHQMLVYEFVANRSLERYLFKEGNAWVKNRARHLDWPTRMRIAIGTAKGLRQCHELEGGRPRIIHCDVKPENILLDETYSVKLSDFGLAKIMGIDKSWTRTHLRGTRGYLAPEWLSGRIVSVKVDVYSFGIVLLEIVNGSRCSDPETLSWLYSEVHDGKVANVIDKNLKSYDEKQILLAIRCGLWCVQTNEELRPSMHTVVEMLEGEQEAPIPPPPRDTTHHQHPPAPSTSRTPPPRPELKQRS